MEKRKLVIVGSGPAGYSAGIYASRALLEPVVIAGEQGGGQLMFTTEVENYAGFPKGIMGPQLMMDMREQAERFGAVMADTYATAADFSDRPFKIWTRQPEGVTLEALGMKGKEEMARAVADIRTHEHDYEAEAVILATGAEPIMLKVPGEADYKGRGVSTCAVCDAAFFRDKQVYVVGGGDAAMEDTLALTKFVREVTVIHRREEFRASKVMQRRVLEDNKDKVSVMWNSEVVEVKGDGQKIGAIRVHNLKTDGYEDLPTNGLFIAIGHKPMNQFLGGEVELDERGYVVTRQGLGKEGLEQAARHLNEEGLVQYPTMTSVEGVFAAGDNVDFRYRQAVTAAGMGTMAALDAEWWLERI